MARHFLFHSLFYVHCIVRPLTVIFQLQNASQKPSLLSSLRRDCFLSTSTQRMIFALLCTQYESTTDQHCHTIFLAVHKLIMYRCRAYFIRCKILHTIYQSHQRLSLLLPSFLRVQPFQQPMLLCGIFCVISSISSGKKYECYYKLSPICACTTNNHANDETWKMREKTPRTRLLRHCYFAKLFFEHECDEFTFFIVLFFSRPRRCWGLNKCKTVKNLTKSAFKYAQWIGKATNTIIIVFVVVATEKKNVPGGNEIIKSYLRE